MAIRNIRTEEDPILRKKSRVVENFDDRLFLLLDDMAETMYSADGVGLAAVQVGVLRRVVVIDIGEGLMELINPEIVEVDGIQCDVEGCLSLPGKQAYTMRPMTVKVKAQNRDGNWCMYKGSGLKAKAFCHEIDHLDGILYVDKIAKQEEIDKYAEKSE
ncbi:MAG: peptide deformylase [Clostridia bacterium]|nr:peptide deformylase [Oscillospiraceae bacterium]MBQ3523133.1 peptide deformylase [Clostridia bacterium]